MHFFRTYLLPGFVFQSVIIAGGYATGRELIEFFFVAGPIGGVLGLMVSGLVFSLVLAVGFELARITRAYDYRHFCRELLGRGWFLFEIFYMIQLLLVLSIIGSASGNLISEAFAVPPLIGTLILMGFIGVLTFNGSETIKKVLAGWSILLYGVYIILFVLAYKNFGPEINNTYLNAPIGDGWLSSGVLYSGYNLATLPVVLFAISHHKNIKETFGSGLIAGPIAVIPAILFFVALMGQYPEISDEAVPSIYLMSVLNIGWFEILFQVVIFGTFVETGTAMLHAVNERLQRSFSDQGKSLPRSARPLIALFILSIAVFAAENFGIINLIAKGYGLLTLIFIAILIVPLMTIGVWKIYRNRISQET